MVVGGDIGEIYGDMGLKGAARGQRGNIKLQEAGGGHSEIQRTAGIWADYRGIWGKKAKI